MTSVVTAVEPQSATPIPSSAVVKVKPTYLFVQTAKQAELDNQKLTLSGVSGNTVWFTDRPARSFGKLDTQSFVDLWKPSMDGNGFGEVPPNAVMVESKSSMGTLQNLGVQGMTLYDPIYNPKTGELTYRITLRTGTLQHPVKLNEVALFVDDMSATEIVFSSTFVPFDSSF